MCTCILNLYGFTWHTYSTFVWLYYVHIFYIYIAFLPSGGDISDMNIYIHVKHQLYHLNATNCIYHMHSTVVSHIYIYIYIYIYENIYILKKYMYIHVKHQFYDRNVMNSINVHCVRDRVTNSLYITNSIIWFSRTLSFHCTNSINRRA